MVDNTMTPGDGHRWCDTCNGGPSDHEPNCPNTFERQAERARMEDAIAKVRAGVTSEVVREAWFAFFARPEGLEHIEVLAPEQLHDSHITLAALERVIIADRLRVLNVSPTPSST